jgi:tetratricopeptide (TPR) repeat protein
MRRIWLLPVCALSVLVLSSCAVYDTSSSMQYAQPAPAVPPSPQSAIQAIKSGIASEPLNWRGYNELGIAYYRQQRYDEAIAAFEQALALHPIFKVVESERAEQNMAEMRHQAAQSAQRQAQAQQSANAMLGGLSQLLGMACAMPGVDPMLAQVAQAGAVGGTTLAQMEMAGQPIPGMDLPNMPQESAFQARQEMGQIHANLGMAYIGRKFYDKAAESLEKSLRMDPSRVEYLKDLGVSYFRMGGYGKAVATLNRFLALCPGTPDPNTFIWLSDSFAAMGLNDAAGQAFNVAVKGFGSLAARNPLDPERLNSLAFASMDHGRFKEAAETYEKALALGRTQPLTLRRLGVCYYCLGRYQDAANVLSQACGLSAKDDAAALWLGRTLAALGQKEESAKVFQDIVARNPGLTKIDRPSLAVAAAYAAVGQTGLAIPWMEAAALENPGDRATAYTYYELAEACIRAGQVAKALDALERSLALDPGALYSRNAVDRVAPRTAEKAKAALQAGDSAAATGKGAEAVASYTEAIGLMPPGNAKNEAKLKLLRLVASMSQPPPLSAEAQDHFLRANVILKSAASPVDIDRAISEYDTALLEAPWDANLYLNKAVGCALRQRYSDAILNMKLYLTAKPKAPDAEAVLTRLHQLEYEREQAAKSPTVLSQLRYEQHYGE